MKNQLVAAFLLTAALPLRAALDYTRYEHPRGDYSVEYPSNWKLSYGIQTVWFRPVARKDVVAKTSMARYPINKNDPVTPKDFLARIKKNAAPIKKVTAERDLTVSGLAATRLELTETVQLSRRHQPLPGPLREVYVVLPRGGDYYVLKLEGIGAAFEEALPEFERMVGTLRLPAKPATAAP